MEYSAAIKTSKAHMENCLRYIVNFRVFCSSGDQLNIYVILDTLFGTREKSEEILTFCFSFYLM